MGIRHTSDFTRALQRTVRGSVFVTVEEPSYEDQLKRPERVYKLRKRRDDTMLATMTVQTLPGCCGVILFRNFAGEPEQVAAFIKLAEIAAKSLGFGMAILTLRAESPIIPLLPDSGVIRFRNGKTDHLVSVVTRLLPQDMKATTTVEGE